MKTVRKIIRIESALCNGCGACIIDCHEAAIAMVNGVATVIKDSLCDGMGDCLGACPTGAITMEERPADPYDESEVERRKQAQGQWPLKIRLVNPENELFRGADLVVAADCAAFKDREFNERYAENPVVIGCPKFNDADLYAERLRELFTKGGVKSCTVSRMQVPCCGGLARAAEKAAEGTGVEVRIEIVNIHG